MKDAAITADIPPAPAVAIGAVAAGEGGGRHGARGFFTGTGLPVFVLTATAIYEVFLCAVVFAPESMGAWGGFAREFKQWCFDYDPRTGGMEWAAVGVMLVEPFFIAATTAFLWRKSLRPWSLWFAHRRSMAGGVVAASVVIGGLFLYGRPVDGADDPLPFPGARIRTRLAPPAFRFVDQRGQPFELGQARGRVVLITGIYAMCSTSCPEILRETKALLDSLPATARVRLETVAVSLNPEYDTAALMTQVAEAHGFSHPDFRFLNGPPAEVHDVLTRLGFSRSVNPVTRVIDHANLFLLVDRDGQIAYRLNLNTRHRGWLREAVLALTDEAERAAGEAVRR